MSFQSWVDACDKLEREADKEEIKVLKALLQIARSDLALTHARLERMGKFLQETDSFEAFIEWENCTLKEDK